MIQIAIADDHALILNGLQKIIASHPDMQVTGAYMNGESLLGGLALQQPDILLLDIQMPGQNGIELAGIIHKKYPSVKIIALTNIEVLPQVKKMMRQGCSGYFLKDVAPDELICAIRSVYEGEEAVHERLRKELTRHFFTSDHPTVITRREVEILRLIADEHTNPEIADKLCISLHTVENHRNRILQKLGVKNTAGLIRKAIEQGLI
ncbi:response regulator transcription factor [Chitinophaga japonensis]|uniref:LuxR family two component transcriptional regulator n=1 Tax=Chitinophaga japonensis TaxID=104662 RepID=A0A562TD23_CHIJA|nr:response regulator transcription factor [Chitinophaga japonensis]TWI90976.1 LuxR family two component transcriptional regulator [Chitinophaga japonensis]